MAARAASCTVALLLVLVLAAVTALMPLTTAASTYFDYSSFMNLSGPNQLSGIITSKITPSYTYNTIDHPITPTHGQQLFIGLGFSGGPLGGNVKELSPTITYTRWFHGLKPGQTFGFRVLSRTLIGYGGGAPPPFARIFMGGEQDVRGFETWSVGPLAYIPSTTTVTVLNQDGSARMQKSIVNGVEQMTNVSMPVPFYQIVFPGGDTQGVANMEYRFKIFGPLTLAAFMDAGVNRVTFRDKLKLNPDRITNLNGEFPSAAFENEAVLVPGSQKPRVSTGLELQIMMPVVNAPFRVYYARNLSYLQTTLMAPVAVDPAMFPNQATYVNARQTIGTAIPFEERHDMFRFTISRTF